MTIGQRMKAPRSSQSGFSVMEVMISMALSLVVTSAMVALMSTSLGNTSRIVNMTKLSDDMRTTMQMLSRDVRRGSYNAKAVYCYGNEDCATDGTVTLAGDITIGADGNCFTYLLDRDHDGDSTENDAGGFRWVNTGGVGVLQMWIGDASAACDGADDANWAAVTDPDSMDILQFAVDDDLSYTEVIFDNGVDTISQRVRKLRIQMQAQLVIDNDIQRGIEDVITVRNDLLL